MTDYTKVFTQERKGFDEGLRNYMIRVYNFMALALVVTGVMAFATLNFAPLTELMYQVTPSGHIVGSSGFGKLVMFAPLGVALFFFMGFSRMSVQTAQMLFWVYACLMGMSLSSLGLMYTGQSLAKTFFITASVFGTMSIYGYTTKRDLTAVGSFMVMGLIGLILVSLVNLFMQSSAIDFALSFIGIIIFMGLIAWDTQKLKAIYYSSGGGEIGQKFAIMGAFTLYLDFINLFLHLLRFFGDRR